MANKNMEIALMISAYDRATRVVNVVTNNAIKKLGDLKKTSDAISKSAFGVGRDTGAAGLAVAAPIVAATIQAAKLEDKMADVAKVMNLEVGGKEFKEMNDQAKDLSVYLSKMPEDAAGLMAAIAQGGTAKKDLLEVSKIAGEMSVAFGIGSEFAGEQFIKSKNALGATIPEVKKLMDSINYLSDNDASQASQILDFMAAGGSGVAKTLGVAGPAMAAYGSSLISMGKSGAEAATIMERFQKGVFESKTMSAIYKKAGGGAEGLMAILEKGSKLKGEEQFNFFSNFGMYGVNIMQMAQSLGHVKDNMNLVSNETNYLDSVTKEFNNRNSTTIGQFNKIKAEALIAGIELGETLLPAVQDLVKEGRPLLKNITEWIKNNKELVGTLMKGGGVIAGMLLTVSAFSYGIGGMFKVISMGSSALSILFKGIKMAQYALFVFRYTMAFQVIPTIISMNAALWANPYALLAAAVIATIAAVTVLIVKWKEITSWWKNSAPIIKLLTIPFIMMNLPIITLAFGIRKLIDNWSKFTAAIKVVASAVNSFLSPLFAGMERFVNYLVNIHVKLAKMAFNIGKTIVTMIWNGINSAAALPVQAIESVVSKMRAYLPFSPAKVGPFKDLHKVKIVETIAGAVKPDPLVKAMGRTTQAASKTGASQAASKAGGSSDNITINVNVNVSGGSSGEGFTKKFWKENASMIAKAIQEELGSKARLKFA